MSNGFWEWLTTKKTVSKPLPKDPSIGTLNSEDFWLPEMVSDHTERQLQEKYPPLKDAWEQYQILLKMYDNKHKTKFQRARSV